MMGGSLPIDQDCIRGGQCIATTFSCDQFVALAADSKDVQVIRPRAHMTAQHHHNTTLSYAQSLNGSLAPVGSLESVTVGLKQHKLLMHTRTSLCYAAGN